MARESNNCIQVNARTKVALFVVVLLLLLSWATAAEDEARAMRLQYTRPHKGEIATGHGTAFAVAENLLFTAAHNILSEEHKPFNTVRIEISGSWVPAKVLCWDRELDVALLSVAAKLQPLQLGFDPDEGDRVEFVGSMRGIPIASYRGVIERRWHGATARTLARVKFDHGMSGCPVIGRDGVVGVAVCGLPKDGDLDHELGLFIPVSIIRWFIQQNRKELSHGSEGKD